MNKKPFADEKIFGSPLEQDHMITWQQFCKNPLPGREFSFFHWFHDATKLTRLHLSKQWKKGLIHGFISRSKAEEILGSCPAGTFLLRFSDSELGNSWTNFEGESDGIESITLNEISTDFLWFSGGISVSWVQQLADGLSEVESMQPFTHNDFDNPKQSIGDIVKGLAGCTHLYPNIPGSNLILKETAFGEYFTPIIKPTNGYVAKHRKFHQKPWANNFVDSYHEFTTFFSIDTAAGPFVTPSENRSIQDCSSSNISSPNWQSPHPNWPSPSSNAPSTPQSIPK